MEDHSATNNEDPRESSLPKWAQNLLKQIRSENQSFRRTLTEMVGNVPEDANAIVMEPFFPHVRRFPVRPVTFDMGRDEHGMKNEVEVVPVLPGEGGPYAKTPNTVLRIRGSRTLVVRPHVSNVISIDLE